MNVLCGLLKLVFLLIPILVCGQSLNVKTTKKTRAEWLAIINWPVACESAFQKTFANREQHGFRGLEFYRVGKQQYLVEIACYPGAYQPGSVLAWYDAKTKDSHLLKLKGLESVDDKGNTLPYSEISGFIIWQNRRQLLEIFSKARGLGDCGFFGRYRIQHGQAILIEAHAKDCDDSPQKNLDPHRWPRQKF